MDLSSYYVRRLYSDRIVAKHQPDFIVPEIEAIRTRTFWLRKQGIISSFCVKAANFTMKRKAIRDSKN
jgi:phosphoribosylglycinamide formyltransferase 2